MKTFCILFLCVIFVSCEAGKKEKIESENNLELNDNLIKDKTIEALRRADSVLSEMTVEQKVGLLFMPAIDSRFNVETEEEIKRLIYDLHVGGILFMNGDTESVIHLSEFCRKVKPGLFSAIDAEWGLKMRLRDAPSFPKNGSFDINADESLLYDYGREVALQCRNIGINLVLGPVLDVADNSHSNIGKRSYGKDPKRVADLGIAYAKGLESGGVLTVAKHFPGLGNLTEDTHKSKGVLKKDLSAFRNTEFYPFAKYIDSGLSGIMVGYQAVPALDNTMTPSAFSYSVITEILKDSLDFKGLVFTDALNMKGAEGFTSTDALLAGADIILSPKDSQAECMSVIRSISEGLISLNKIEESGRKILFFRFMLDDDKVYPKGLSDPAIRQISSELSEKLINKNTE